jgi:cytochrome c oxidase subunit 2
MDRSERLWFGLLIVVAVVVNVITLSPLVPWQKWLLWSKVTPDQRVAVEFVDCEIRMPTDGVEVKAGEFVEFVATSGDVTYGLGVFRTDGTMVFQMQVLPQYENTITWRFDAPGFYSVRSTEYSGPNHSEMFVENAIQVVP